jgi:phosphatidylserine/phosphatidylglycerophosphate/cardiolipin synthase-like enzyme
MTTIGRTAAAVHALALALSVATGCVSGVSRIDSRAAFLSAQPAADPYLATLADRLGNEGRARSGRPGTEPGLAAAAPSGNGAADERREITTGWRTARQTFYLAPPNAASGDEPFAFSGAEAQSVEIELVQVDTGYYRLEFACDGELTVRNPAGRTRHPARRHVTLSSSGGTDRALRLVLLPGKTLTRCEGRAHYASGSRPFRIVRLEAVRPALARPDREYHRCVLPRRADADPLADAFYAASSLSETCPFRLPHETPLVSERDGFDAKVEALLGTRLPARFYETGNPGLPLDFSQAPALSEIFISYLDIKADFSGMVIDRLLRHHAARGARIRILASAVLERPKDRAMLQRLAADHPNVSYKAHVWEAPPGSTPALALSQFHRVNHAKLLAAIAVDPRRSVAIIGGRNIHDGFLFDSPLDLSAYPSLHQYGQARGMNLNYYSNWRDIDFAFHDDRTARMLAAHLATLWEDDALSRVVRPFSIAVRGAAAPHEGFARHFLSVPYTDGRALEEFYAGLIDAARTRIAIVNPYLNLTDRLRQSLDRALARGVVVTIVGRISLAGDLGGNLMTAINEAFVARYYDRLKIYNYRDPKVLLHAKILVIDGRLSVVSGVNLNNRSFIHDTENGMVVFDRGFARRAEAVIEGFRAESDLVTEPPKRSLRQLMLGVRVIREAL